MFTRTESFQQFVKLYPAVSTLLMLNIILFLLSLLPVFPNKMIFELGSGYNRAIADGEWWRLITSIFLHRSFSHLLLNCFSMVILAPTLERMLGRISFFIFFMAVGTAANLATYIINPLSFSHIGASNAILGVLGFYLYMALFHKKRLSRQNTVTVYALTALSVIMTFMQPEINHVGHLSGLAAGIVFASFFQKKISHFWF
ncbi:rhomboid family intramembrane serine protease [Bacillus sp. CECT 9360]|uniref:rhomboid family intramembrane serine protease n=1 Tax=Bacillus sp. CECT 9360 TaxID=2845821 RepID=UPI001E3C0F8E|nr:rhomboid family intramembrane serine protease [Bacillus sp. CECT 9360]CAH0347194.1 hypothetical protein BCI9360_03583 [Bacillus sp. CECT 9360]